MSVRPSPSSRAEKSTCRKASSSWLSDDKFESWKEEGEGYQEEAVRDRGAPKESGSCGTMRRLHGGMSSGVMYHDDEGRNAACKIIIRCRNASTAWERMVRTVVGNPVHLDIVLSKQGSQGSRFCFSSYMHHRFEMVLMDEGMIRDKTVDNICLEITDDEYERCMGFLMALEGRAKYDYFDAMVLMPLTPKDGGSSLPSSILNALVQDADSCSPENIKKVFCSQSVILMLRYALNPQGTHCNLLKQVNELNSKLVSPKQVMQLLQHSGARPMSNDELIRL